MTLKTLSFTYLFLSVFSLLIAQNPIKITKNAIDRVSVTPFMQNLKKNKGINLFGNAAEGLRVAAINGRFGYLNKIMDWHIPPQYDYAFDVSEGLGIVFINGQPSYIDKNGHEPFKTDFAKDLAPFQNGRALFRTHTGKMGMFNKQGHLILDTVFNKIYPFIDDIKRYNGISIKPQTRYVTTVTRMNPNTEYALVDTSGKFIIPFGEFSHIELIDNYFRRNLTVFKATNHQFLALFDASGKEIFRIKEDSTRAFQIVQPLHIDGGFIMVEFPEKETADDKKEDTEPSLNGQIGLINFKGELVLNDTNIVAILDFDDKYAFIRTKENKEKLIEIKTGEAVKLSPMPIRMPNFFELKQYGKGVAQAPIPLSKSKWGILDSCWTWIIPPLYDDISLRDDGKKAPYFVLRNNLSPESAKLRNIQISNDRPFAFLDGIADIQGKIIFQPDKYRYLYPLDSLLQNFHFETADGFLVGNINRNGKISQQRKINTEQRQKNYISKGSQTPKYDYEQIEWKINIDGINCNPDDKIGGIQPICNPYQRLSIKPEMNTLHILIDKLDSTISRYNFNHSALKAKIINASKEAIPFTTYHYQLKIKIEAQDSLGKWRDISYVRPLTPYEKQLNKPENVFSLPPQYFWEIELPTFAGCLKTQFRCVIFSGKGGDKPIISDTWEGGINPAQFWRKPLYSPSSVFSKWYIDEP